jgi:hypothetical protein
VRVKQVLDYGVCLEAYDALNVYQGLNWVFHGFPFQFGSKQPSDLLE